jgi:hypothetical protein
LKGLWFLGLKLIIFLLGGLEKEEVHHEIPTTEGLEEQED